jgi:hypothetical protein
VTVLERLAAVLAVKPGLTARDLVLVLQSEGLDLKKSEVNHYLDLGRDMFRREGDPPKWYLGTAVSTYQGHHRSAVNGTGGTYQGRHRSAVNGADGNFITVKRGPQFYIETEDLPGAPFFRVDQRGGCKILCLNRSHQFYTFYDSVADESGHALIHVILVAYGDSELDATGEHAMWSQLVRDLWSHRCARVLDQITNDGATDQKDGSI